MIISQNCVERVREREVWSWQLAKGGERETYVVELSQNLGLGVLIGCERGELLDELSILSMKEGRIMQ